VTLAMTVETNALPTLPRVGTRARVGLLARLVRLALMALGVLVIIAGILISPLPGPMGLPVAVVGLMLVLRNSYWAKRQFIRMQQARPNWVFPFRRLMRKRPEFAPVFWQQILRIERLLLKKGQRVLGRLRRRGRANARRTTA
jgi:hypothetical protein